MIKYRFIIILLFFLFPLIPVFTDSIRGPLVKELTVEGVMDYKRQIAIQPSDLASLSLDKNIRFLKGIQLEMTISEQFKRYADSFALEIYSCVSVRDKTDGEYEGKRIFFEILPFINKVFIRIPVGNRKINKDYLPPGTYSLLKPVEVTDFPIFFSIQPIMKGIPDSVIEKKLYINIEADVEKAGILDLAVAIPEHMEKAAYDIYIDDEAYEKSKREFILKAGFHSLKIISEEFKEATANFAIEPGKTTKVEIPLETIASVMIIDIMEEAALFIDGARIVFSKGAERPISAGPHTFLIKVGSQTITRKIDVKSGKRYTLSLLFDMDVKEN